MRKAVWFAVFSTLMTGCSTDTLVDRFNALPDYGWAHHDTTGFEFVVEDVEAYYNDYFQLRITKDYPLSNIYIKAYFYKGDSFLFSNIRRYMLAEKSGKWKGSGLGSTVSYELPLRENHEFQDTGLYRVEFQPYLRIDTLPAVSDVGYRITKIQSQLK